MRAEQGFKHIILVRSHALSQMRRLDQSHIAISQKKPLLSGNSFISFLELEERQHAFSFSSGTKGAL